MLVYCILGVVRMGWGVEKIEAMLTPEDLIKQRYTGMYVSNNKFQKSVAFGDQAPLGGPDPYSRLHDTDRAVYQPGLMWRASDSIYHEDVSKLPGTYASLAGDAVLYGNAGINSFENLGRNVYKGAMVAGPLGAVAGLVVGGVENMVDLYQYMTHADEAKAEIRKMHKTDPYPYYQYSNQAVEQSASPDWVAQQFSNKGLKVELTTSNSVSHQFAKNVAQGTAGISSLGITYPDFKNSVATSASEGAGAQFLKTAKQPSEGMTTEVYNPPSGITVLDSVSPSTQRVGSGENLSMAKNKQKKKTMVPVRAPKAPTAKPKKKKSARASSGAITAISTAPVAIGNSVQGCSSVVLSSGKNGVTIRGRDFMFAPIGTGTVTTWTLCGGTPLSPAAFADTTLGTYMRLFAKFRFKALAVHYITSSPTSANGDVMFYYGKDRSSVFLNQTSPQLLGFVLSDTNTVIGPQWTNHSAVLKVSGEWKMTDYGMHDGVAEYADGEIFLMSKTSTTDSPGYVLFDYVIEFADHQLQPRLLTFPIPRIQWSQLNIGVTAMNVTANNSIHGTLGMSVKGNNLSGSTSSLPTGTGRGDIFKMIVDLTNSNAAGWTNATAGTVLKVGVNNSAGVFTPIDGMTLYAVYDSGHETFSLFENATQAFTSAYSSSDGNGICWGVTTAALTMNFQVWISYIGTLNSDNLLPNF